MRITLLLSLSDLWKPRLTGLVAAAALVLLMVCGYASATESGAEEPTRIDIESEITDLGQALENKLRDAETRFAYAQALYKGSHFWRADAAIVPLLQEQNPPPGTLLLAAQLANLIGDYERAESMYKKIIDTDPAGKIMAMVKLAFTYYQQDKYDEIRALEFPPGVQLPNLVPIQEQFVDGEEPYALEWANEEKFAIVPFIVTDDLPVMTVEVNGVPLTMIFDTGADTLIIDDEVAAALSIESVASAMGSFGGGLQSEIGFGKVERVKLGEVTMRSVPVTILPTKRFSSGFTDGKYTIGGIFGTAFMREFLGTLDYKNERLILRERSSAGARKFRDSLKNRIAGEVPFALNATHIMLAKGSINGVDGLTFFVDSGLAMERAKFTAPIQTLNVLGILEPETKVDENSVGGGGGAFASGEFSVDSIGLGELVQKVTSYGEYGSSAPESYWAAGFIQDALISHRYLRQYSSWTLDFDNMTYIFEQ
jgi:hypothetical protein